MFAVNLLGSRTPLSSESSRSNVLIVPFRIPRQLRGVIWLSEGVLPSEPAILHTLLSADAGRRMRLLGGCPL
jgi:hypothetical protein